MTDLSPIPPSGIYIHTAFEEFATKASDLPPHDAEHLVARLALREAIRVGKLTLYFLDDQDGPTALDPTPFSLDTWEVYGERSPDTPESQTSLFDHPEIHRHLPWGWPDGCQGQSAYLDKAEFRNWLKTREKHQPRTHNAPYVSRTVYVDGVISAPGSAKPPVKKRRRRNSPQRKAITGWLKANKIHECPLDSFPHIADQVAKWANADDNKKDFGLGTEDLDAKTTARWLKEAFPSSTRWRP